MFNKLTTLYQENREQGHLLLFILATFLVIYFVPAGTARFDNAILEAVRLTNWYAEEHVILCLLPAFVIAGAMAVYISQGSVLRYLGPLASKPIALGVASVSGTLLAVCSCTVLPLFGGIYKRGAGLGAAIAFLYSGPAINIMAIVVTAKVLGPELGIARAVGAIIFAVVIGACMYFSTLTEVPIVEGLLGSGMGKGPALALLLAGLALSLPNMLVIRSILGTEKTVVYCSLVVVMATYRVRHVKSDKLPG